MVVIQYNDNNFNKLETFREAAQAIEGSVYTSGTTLNINIAGSGNCSAQEIVSSTPGPGCARKSAGIDECCRREA